jgi:hypothetical protein
MNRFTILLAALVLSATLPLTSAASNPPGGQHGGNSGQKPSGQKPSGQKPGGQKPGAQKFHGYKSHSYHGWSRYCWFPNYGCYGYYCPDDDTWYYWYGPGNCYRPVSDMASNPPDSSNPPSLPPGATKVS